MDRILIRLFIFFCAALIFLQPVRCFGQNKYSIQHYTNENGLPANSIIGIELDKTNGFLWVATQAGLVRFDGKSFKSFSTAQQPVAASRIAILAKNREGSIFCEDDNFAVYRVKNNQPAFAETDTFLVDPGIVRGGSFRQRSPGQVAQKIKATGASGFLPNWAAFDDDSSSFSFIYSGYDCYYDATEDSLYTFPTGSTFQEILKLNGRVYFVHESRDLWVFDASLKKLVSVPVKNMPQPDPLTGGGIPRFIWRPGMKQALLLYKKDIWLLQPGGNTPELVPLCRDCSPEKAIITSAQVWEEQGTIFLASILSGLYVVENQFLRTLPPDIKDKLLRLEYAQAEIIPGLITTPSGLTFSSTGQLMPSPKGIRFTQSNTNIYQDQNGDAWFYSGDTIIHFRPHNSSFTQIAVNDKAFRMVFAETQGRLYVISDIAIGEITNDRYRLLYQLPPAGKAMKNSLNPDAAIEWKPGVLAIAAEKLLLLDTKKKQAPDTIPITGLTTKVRALLKYGNYLLIGTYGQGFYMYKDGIVKKMPLDKYRYLSYTHCFVPDSKGFCWISTNHGLFKVSLDALVKAYENNLDEIYYQYFGKDDGIVNTEFNGGCQPCALKLSNGLYSFPSMNGVVVFDPLEKHTPPPAGQVFVDEVLADGQSFQINDRALSALPYQLKDLRFNLSLPQFGNPENIYFSYKLEPYNDEWETQDIIQNNIIQFGGLKPGTYTLSLRVRNGFEPNQFGMTTVKFSILKPWYQAWWFYLLCVLGFIAILWGLIKWRTARIAKRKEELQELVTLQTKDLAQQSRQLESQLQQLQNQQARLEEDNDIKARLIGIISHDMISPLKFMGYMSKRLKEGFTESDPSYRTVGFIANVAQELESLSVNILNWIKFHHQSIKMKPEKFSLPELVAESVEIPAILAKEKGLFFNIDVPEHTQMIQYRQAIGVIIYNLSMNATKYTGKGGISVKSREMEDGVVLIITDTGAGMPPALVKKLNSMETFAAGYSIGETSKYQFGYVIIKDLLRQVEGRITVDSVENKGTVITLQFGKIADTGV